MSPSVPVSGENGILFSRGGGEGPRFARGTSFCSRFVVGYFSRSLSIHRGKLENADNLWNKHLNEMLVPCLDTSMLTMHTFQAPKVTNEKLDVVIHGLGWFCISGQIQDVYVRVHKGINVTFRKAMI